MSSSGVRTTALERERECGIVEPLLYLMALPMTMLHWKKKKKIAQNFAKTSSALAPVSLATLVMVRW